MMIEMLLLVPVAAAVFAYVLAPIVRAGRSAERVEEPREITVEETREPVASDGQPVRDMP